MQCTPHRCIFEHPGWVNIFSPTLDCIANLQLLKRQRSEMLFFYNFNKLPPPPLQPCFFNNANYNTHFNAHPSTHSIYTNPTQPQFIQLGNLQFLLILISITLQSKNHVLQIRLALGSSSSHLPLSAWVYNGSFLVSFFRIQCVMNMPDK